MLQLFIASSPGEEGYDGHDGHDDDHDESTRLFSDRVPQSPVFLFAAATSHVSHLSDVLALISAVDRHALMVISPYGITFFSEYNHILNAQVTVDASLFSAFEYHWTRPDASLSPPTESLLPRNVQLGIDIHKLSDAFAAAAATVAPRGKSWKPVKPASKTGATKSSSGGLQGVLCYIKYRGEGHHLIVEFEDRLMSEQIEFATYHLDLEFPYGDENPELQFRGSPADSPAGSPTSVSGALSIDHSALQFEVILQSDILANLLQDLQSLGTEDLYMYVSNVPGNGASATPNLMFFLSKGAIGFLKLIYPSARTMLQKLEVYRENEHEHEHEPVPTSDSVLSTLGFPPFIKVFRAVKLSSKCKIMKDFSGVLLIQLLCRNTAAKSYPGTLIAFNMLEKSDLGGMGNSIDVDLDGLFDEKVYQQVREYDQTPAGEPLGSNHSKTAEYDANEPFSYASFINRTATEEPLLKRIRGDRDEQNASNTATDSIPVFL